MGIRCLIFYVLIAINYQTCQHKTLNTFSNSTGAEQQQKSHLLFFKTIDNKDIPLPKVRGPVWQAFVAASGKKLASSETLPKPLRRPTTANATTTSRSWTQLSTIEKQNNSYNQRNNNPFLRESSSEESLETAMAAMASSSKAASKSETTKAASKSETTRTTFLQKDDNEEEKVPVAAAERSPQHPPAIIRMMSAPLATEDSGLAIPYSYSC